MTNETKAPTKEELRDLLNTALGDENAAKARSAEATKALLDLHDAALLGAQVPGLVADKEAVRRQLDRVHGHLVAIAKNLGITEALSGPEFEAAAQEFATKLKTAESEVSALQAQVPGLREELTGMTDNFDRAASGLVLATKQVSALQARVVELERERDGWKLTAENRKRWWEEAKSGRDALRAQVDGLRKNIDTAGHMLSFSDAGTVQWFLMAALSAPPTETPRHDEASCAGDVPPCADASCGDPVCAKYRSAPPAEMKQAPISDAAWCGLAAAREGDLEVAVGPTAETPAPERCATGNTCVCGDCPNADE